MPAAFGRGLQFPGQFNAKISVQKCLVLGASLLAELLHGLVDKEKVLQHFACCLEFMGHSSRVFGNFGTVIIRQQYIIYEGEVNKSMYNMW